MKQTLNESKHNNWGWHGKFDQFKTVKEEWQISILLLCLCESYAEYTIKIPGEWITSWHKGVGRNINNLRCIDGNTKKKKKKKKKKKIVKRK